MRPVSKLMMGRLLVYGTVVVAALWVASASAHPVAEQSIDEPPALPPPAPPALSSPTLFAADSPWNRKLGPDEPLDPESPQLAQSLAETVASHGAWVQSDSYSTPLYVVPADQPTVKVTLDSWRAGTPMQELFNQGVPIPDSAKQAAGSDAHMTIWQPDTDKLWEFWAASRDSEGNWHAQTGGAFEHVSESPGYYSAESWPPYSDHTWGATASSLPVVAGTTLASEFRDGVIPHALAIDLPDARGGVWAWPAQQSDGSAPASALPEGAHIRLPPDIDLSGLPEPARIIAVALRDYGGIVRDRTGSSLGLYFEDRVALSETDPFYGDGGLFGGQWPNHFLAEDSFPWAKIQVLQTSLCSDWSEPCAAPTTDEGIDTSPPDEGIDTPSPDEGVDSPSPDDGVEGPSPPQGPNS